MSQNFDIMSGFNSMKKMGRFLLFFHELFSRFHEIKSKPKIKKFRYASLHMSVLYKYVKFYARETIKVKKSIFPFLTPSFCYFFANIHITHKFR